MYDIIKSEVCRLTKKHKTTNPFDIAAGENIIILFEPLGSINGFYNRYVRQKFIHVNNYMNENTQLFTCCHELGHAIMHPCSNTPFLRSSTFFSVNKLEYQANMFAAELLISDDLLNEYRDFSIEQISNITGINIELIKLKIKI